METALLYRYSDKQLSFKLREKLSSSQVDVKFHGELNTTTGDWRHDVQVFSALYPVHAFKQSKPRRQTVEPFFSAIGVGARLHYRTSRAESTNYKIGAWMRNELRFEVPHDCWARVDVESMYNPHRSQFEHVIHARINKIFLSLTSKQDLKCTVGWHAVAFNNRPTLFRKSYVEVQENNWSCQVDSDKRINVMYHL